MRTTQSTPAGCFIGALALFPLVCSGLGGFGLFRWCQLPSESRHIDQRFWILVCACAGGLVVAAIILWIAARVLKASDLRDYDSRDPKQTNLKW